ncbi:MAG: hypothetical protein KC933_08600 [Myxococcales bacterium]|nr:hypothetical protein [Myxococcales bacterium]
MNPRGAGVGFVDHARLHSQVIESPPASPERWHTRPTEQEVTSALRKLMSDADAGLLVEGHIAALQGLGIMVPFFTDMRILAARSFAKRNDRIVEEQRQAQEERIGQLVAQLESDALAQLHEALRRILTQDPRDA